MRYENRLNSVLGHAFIIKIMLKHFVSCGIERKLAIQHKDNARFVWERNLMNELDEHPNG